MNSAYFALLTVLLRQQRGLCFIDEAGYETFARLAGPGKATNTLLAAYPPTIASSQNCASHANDLLAAVLRLNQPEDGWASIFKRFACLWTTKHCRRYSTSLPLPP